MTSQAPRESCRRFRVSATGIPAPAGSTLHPPRERLTQALLAVRCLDAGLPHSSGVRHRGWGTLGLGFGAAKFACDTCHGPWLAGLNVTGHFGFTPNPHLRGGFGGSSWAPLKSKNVPTIDSWSVLVSYYVGSAVDAAEAGGPIGPGGFEPPFPDPKSGVLPLDEGPALLLRLNLGRSQACWKAHRRGWAMRGRCGPRVGTAHSWGNSGERRPRRTSRSQHHPLRLPVLGVHVISTVPGPAVRHDLLR